MLVSARGRGCLPRRGVCKGVSAQGGVCLGDVCLGGECLPGDVCPGGCLPRGCVSQHVMGQTPPCEQNNRHV